MGAPCKCEEEIRVKIGILIIGNQDKFEHVRCVRTRNFVFSHESEIVNFDDIVDYEELLTLKPKSQYLSGENGESFKILLTITPLSKYFSKFSQYFLNSSERCLHCTFLFSHCSLCYGL